MSELIFLKDFPDLVEANNEGRFEKHLDEIVRLSSERCLHEDTELNYRISNPIYAG